MNTTSPVSDVTQEMRDKIVLAAEQRFEIYGYNKTTMAEIAEDLNMSAANLYRFFKNKKSIAEQCAKRCVNDRIGLLRSVVDETNLSAAAKLDTFIQTCLQVSYEQAEKNARINELIISVTQDSPALVEYKITHERQLLTDIINQGNRTGEFAVFQIDATATALHSSILLFDVPLFMGLYSLQEFKTMASQTTELLLNGLLAR